VCWRLSALSLFWRCTCGREAATVSTAEVLLLLLLLLVRT
jgi:hypothetical protein